MNFKTTKTVLAFAAAALLAFGARAKNYSTIFSQDFEDANTYTNEARYGAVASTLLGTTALTPSALTDAWIVYNESHSYSSPDKSSDHFVSWESRNNVRTGDSSHYLSSCMGKQGKGETVARLMLVLPEKATSVTDYIVEFDYNLSTSYSNNSNSQSNGLVVVGSSGNILATFATKPGGSSAGTAGYLFRGDSNASGDILASSIPTGIRGTRDTEGYWLHVTITGNQDDGVWISFTSENGKKTLASTQLTETFDTVSQLFIYHYAKMYVHYGVIDDIVVQEAVDAKTFAWTGAAGDGKWATPGNWNVGSEPQTDFYPGETDTAEIQDANRTIYVTPDQGFGTVTAPNTTTLAVLFTENAQTFTAPTDFAGTVVAAGPFAMTSEAGVYTATRKDSTFVWANAEGGDWVDAANWTVDGRETAVIPTVKDAVVFNDAVTVTATATALCSNLVVNAQVTVANMSDKMLSIGDAANDLEATVSVSGMGSLVLSGARVRAGFETVNIDVPLEIAANTTNVLLVGVNKTYGGYGFKVNQAVTGSGKLEVTQTSFENNAGTGVRFIGDMSGFTGSVEFYQAKGSRSGKVGYQARAQDLIYPSANGENAAWNIYADHWGDDIEVGRESGNYFAESDATYKFGALKLRLPTTKNDKGYCTNVTLEVGKLDVDSYAKYSWKSAANCGINWIAPTATFVNEAANTAFLNVSGGGVMVLPVAAGVPTSSLSFTDKGGTLKVGYDLVADSEDPSITNAVPVDPSAVIKNSTAAIVFDDQGTNCTWATTLDASNAGGLVKRGAGTLTINKGTALNGALQIEGGKLWFGGEILDEFETLVSWDVVDGAKEVTLNDIDVKGSVSLQIVTNDTRVLLQGRRAGQAYTYVGGDFGLWSEIDNWKVGEAAAVVAPNATDTVTIGGGNRVIVQPGQEFGALTLADGAKLAVQFTEGGQTIALPAGLSESDVIACGPFALSLSEGVFTSARVPSTFVWTGSAADGVWETLGNWSVNGTPTCTAMDRTDTALFTSEATVTLTDNPSVTNLTIRANVTIDGGANTHCIQQLNEVVSENGAILTLNNARLQSRDLWQDPATWTADIAIVGDCQLRAYTYNTGSDLSKLYYNGKLSGSGNLTCMECRSKNTSRAGVVLGGDNSAFCGTFTMKAGNTGASGNSSRTPGFIGAAQALSSNAVWNIVGNNNYKDQLTDIRSCRGTSDNYTKLYFGALNGTWYAKVHDPSKTENNPYYNMFEEFVIGGANVDCTFNPIFSRAGAGDADRTDSYLAIRKVGTAELSIVGEDPGTSVYRYTVEDGTLKLNGKYSISADDNQFIFAGGDLKIGCYEASSNIVTVISEDPYVTETNVVSYIAQVDPSKSIVNSTGAISFDDEGTNHTWAAALAASNMGGLVKKGAGTLTLEKTPKYAGVTTIEAGTLVVPAETKVALNAASAGTLEGGEITNVLFAADTTATSVATDPGAVTVKSYACAIDYANVTIDLSEKTDWTKNATYYVITPAGIVAGTGIANYKGHLVLPADQQGKWTLRVVELAGYGKVLTVVPRIGLVLSIQ